MEDRQQILLNLVKALLSAETSVIGQRFRERMDVT